MYCSRCGAANNDTSRYCVSCGAELALPFHDDREYNAPIVPGGGTFDRTAAVRRWAVSRMGPDATFTTKEENEFHPRDDRRHSDRRDNDRGGLCHRIWRAWRIQATIAAIARSLVLAIIRYRTHGCTLTIRVQNGR